MKKTTLPALIIALFLTACTSGEKPPTYAELQQHHQTAETAASDTEPETADPAESEAAELREKAAEAVSKILTENRETAFVTAFCGTQTAVECDGGIYIDDGITIRLLNRRTGLLQGLCSDPLCKHESCIESYLIDSMVSDGDRLYIKGHSTSYSEFAAKKWKTSSFIASYDPEKNKFEFLDVWEKDRGAVSVNITLHNGYLYHTKKVNEQTNSLYRIPITGGESERLTFKDEFVQIWTVSDEKIVYRTDSFTLKSMNHDGSQVEILDEFICMVYADGDDLYKVSVKNENGYQVYRNNETLPVRVFSPVSTVLTDGALWYTVPDEQILGTYTDEYGREKDIITPNGTTFYRYALKTGEWTEYDCPFSYGVHGFCGTIGKYMLVRGMLEDMSGGYWIFNPEDPSEAYRLYEY